MTNDLVGPKGETHEEKQQIVIDRCLELSTTLSSQLLAVRATSGPGSRTEVVRGIRDHARKSLRDLTKWMEFLD